MVNEHDAGKLVVNAFSFAIFFVFGVLFLYMGVAMFLSLLAYSDIVAAFYSIGFFIPGLFIFPLTNSIIELVFKFKIKENTRLILFAIAFFLTASIFLSNLIAY